MIMSAFLAKKRQIIYKCKERDFREDQPNQKHGDLSYFLAQLLSGSAGKAPVSAFCNGIGIRPFFHVEGAIYAGLGELSSGNIVRWRLRTVNRWSCVRDYNQIFLSARKIEFDRRRDRMAENSLTFFILSFLLVKGIP